MSEIKYSKVPKHMREGARRYIEHGTRPGSFLQAALENNFVEAIGHADRTNMGHLLDWARWLYNDIPGDCWGSAAKVRVWQDHKGLECQKKRRAKR